MLPDAADCTNVINPLKADIDYGRVVPAFKFGCIGALALKVCEVIEEKYPRGLFDVVHFVRDTFFGAQVPFDLVECVFVPLRLVRFSCCRPMLISGIALAKGRKKQA